MVVGDSGAKRVHPLNDRPNNDKINNGINSPNSFEYSSSDDGKELRETFKDYDANESPNNGKM